MVAASVALRRLARLLDHAFGGPEDRRANEGDEDEKSDELAGSKEDDRDSDDGEVAEDEDEDEDEDEKKGLPSVGQWFADCKDKFRSCESFHTLHLREDHSQVLLSIRRDRLDIPFFNQLTFTGAEGGLSDMIDVTPSTAGFQFRWAPNGKDLQLTQMQQRLTATDLASSLYDAGTGGALSGCLRLFKPLASDKVAGSGTEGMNVADGQVKEANGVSEEGAAGSGASAGAVASKQRGAQQAEGGADGTGSSEKKEKGSEGQTKDDKARKRRKKKKPRKKAKASSPPPGEEAVLIDVTGWFGAFAISAASNRGQGLGVGGRRGGRSAADSDALLVEVGTFPRNFWLRYMVQQRGESPVKSRDDASSYFSVAFCRLPEVPMVPREKDRRVGFFETAVRVGGEKRVNEVSSVINRWNLARHDWRLTYYIDPEVPAIFRATIRQGVEAWSAAFAAAGCGEGVVRCVAPGDEDFPSDYSRGDARYSAIYMTDSLLPVYGFGPSLTDFRTGEILVANVLLGLSVFVEEASRHSAEALAEPLVRSTGGCRPPLLDADHSNVLDNLLFTVMHEVGHTLGLRHNFIAQEDGNSSVMAYPDTLDTLANPLAPKFGGHLLREPGRYDLFAIKYGYTPLQGESVGQRHPALDVLANGQEASDTSLSLSPLNPRFATDEDVGMDDPRVNRWNQSIEAFGYDKLDHALEQRRGLLELVRSGRIYPETFTDRLRTAYYVAHRHVHDSLRLVGGSMLDATRTRYEPCAPSTALSALAAVVDFCVGPLGRVSAEEDQYMMRAFPRNGYQVNRIYLLSAHKDNIRSILGSALTLSRLERLEMQRSVRQETHASPGTLATPSSASSSLPPHSVGAAAGGADDAAGAGGPTAASGEMGGGSGPSLGTFDVLTALAYRPGRKAEGIFHPFGASPLPSLAASGGTDGMCGRGREASREPVDWAPPSCRELSRAALDVPRAEAALELARLVNDIAHDPDALAVVRAGARAFIQEAAEALRAAEQSSGRGLDAVAKAHWAAVLEELTRPPDRDAAGGGGFLPFLLFGEEAGAEALEEQESFHRPGMRCGQASWLRLEAAAAAPPPPPKATPGQRPRLRPRPQRRSAAAPVAATADEMPPRALGPPWCQCCLSPGSRDAHRRARL